MAEDIMEWPPAARAALGEAVGDLDRMRRERDRYRSALERVESHGSGEAVRIARDALREEQHGS